METKVVKEDFESYTSRNDDWKCNSCGKINRARNYNCSSCGLIEDSFKIISEDCIKGMKKIKSKSVDCIITDPPFFMPATHYASRITYQRNFGDLTPLKVFWDVIVKELRRILKDEGHLFVFCNCDSYPVFYEPTYNHFDKLKSLVWDKTRIGLGRIFRNQHELIIWARNKNHKFIQDGKLRADVLSFPATLSKDRVHPVEKPVELLKELVLASTNEGDIVFDPFMGGGSTMLACKETGRKGIGIDIDSRYCELVKERLSKEIQKTLKGGGGNSSQP